PSNPLDCATDLNDDFPKVFENALRTFAAAPEVSMVGLEADFRDDFIYQEGVYALAKALPTITEKPCFLYTSFGQANNRRIGTELADLGVPCLNGAEATMSAVRKYQEWSNRSIETIPSDLGIDDAMLSLRASAKIS